MESLDYSDLYVNLDCFTMTDTMKAFIFIFTTHWWFITINITKNAKKTAFFQPKNGRDDFGCAWKWSHSIGHVNISLEPWRNYMLETSFVLNNFFCLFLQPQRNRQWGCNQVLPTILEKWSWCQTCAYNAEEKQHSICLTMEDDLPAPALAQVAFFTVFASARSLDRQLCCNHVFPAMYPHEPHIKLFPMGVGEKWKTSIWLWKLIF